MDTFYERLKEFKFRIQSEYLLANMQQLVVLDWFVDGFLHKYLAVSLDEEAYNAIKDNVGAYMADRFVDLASVQEPKTRIGRWLVKFSRKHL